MNHFFPKLYNFFKSMNCPRSIKKVCYKLTTPTTNNGQHMKHTNQHKQPPNIPKSDRHSNKIEDLQDDITKGNTMLKGHRRRPSWESRSGFLLKNLKWKAEWQHLQRGNRPTLAYTKQSFHSMHSTSLTCPYSLGHGHSSTPKFNAEAVVISNFFVRFSVSLVDKMCFTDM